MNERAITLERSNKAAIHIHVYICFIMTGGSIKTHKDNLYFIRHLVGWLLEKTDKQCIFMDERLHEIKNTMSIQK